MNVIVFIQYTIKGFNINERRVLASMFLFRSCLPGGLTVVPQSALEMLT